MPTRFRLTSTASAQTPPFSAGWNVTGAALRKALYRSGRSAAATLSASDTTAATPENVLIGQWISDPLAGQNIAGTFKGQILASEANVAADSRMQVRVLLVDPTATTVRAVLFELDNVTALASEFATALTNRKIPFTGPAALSAFDAQQGDRLVVELGYRTANSTATAYSHSFNVGEPSILSELPEDETTTTTTLDAWVEFSQLLVVLDGEGAGSGGPGIMADPQNVAGTGFSASNAGTWPDSGGTSGAGFSPDTTPPVITNITPASGTIATSQGLSFRVIDETLLKKYVVLIKYSSFDRYEVAWDGFAWDTRYVSGSSRTAIVQGYDVVVSRTEGWPSGFDFVIIAYDGGGNTTEVITSYALTAYAPSVYLVTPTSGSTLATPNTAIAFNVIDPTKLGKIVIRAFYAGLGRTELIYDGALIAPYAAVSTGGQLETTPEWAFSIRRSPGWPEAPVIKILAIDADANAVETTLTYSLGSSTPSVSAVSPASGSLLSSPAAAVALTVSDPTILSKVIIRATYSGVGRTETVYDGTTLLAPYVALSTATPSGSLSIAFSLRRSPGWPEAPIFSVFALDGDGNITTTALSYTLASASPTVSGISPTSGSALATPTTPIAFTVSDPTGLRNVVVRAAFATLARSEVIYNGAALEAPFAVGSTATPSGSTSLAFSVVRTPGWPDAPTIYVSIVDVDGNVVTASIPYTLTGPTVPVIGPITIT